MAPVVTRKRISYVLPLNTDENGHRLGVNGLAFDESRSILYSAGRDGVICAWDAASTSDVSNTATTQSKGAGPSDKARNAIPCLRRAQAHSHWINDLCLIQGRSALISASSDLSVKIWQPFANHAGPPQTLGLHTDYVKRVASPGHPADWVAAGGLDRRVTLWDLSGAGKRLDIDTADEDAPIKGSIYALACNGSLIATGGPESVIKLWDPNSGKRITRFVGHTDNIRDILISQDNDTIITASSDRTVKMWSLTAGRCIHTFGMHKDSVWCLASSDPELSVFYSGDRSGIVAKTDIREESDDGVSVAIAQETGGINKIIPGRDAIWTGTGSSSINSWQDADLSIGVQTPETMKPFRVGGGVHSRTSMANTSTAPTSPTDDDKHKLPFSCVLRLSNMAGHLGTRSGPGGGRLSTVFGPAGRKASVAPPNADGSSGSFAPLRSAPLSTIQGQDGLIKHVVLSDKQRALTSDTTGNVMLWDLLKCSPIKSFGKQDLDKLASEFPDKTSIARWCTVETRTGTLTVTLDEQHGFDAEVFLDDTEYAKSAEFREDQKVNLGRWILRYLFDAFLEEEIRRDEIFCHRLMPNASPVARPPRTKPTMALSMPSPSTDPWNQPGNRNAVMTPGSTIGLASPMGLGIGPLSGGSQLSSGPSESTPTDNARTSTDGRPSGYFGSQPPTSHPTDPSSHSSTEDSRSTKAASEASDDKAVASPAETVKSPGTPGRFGKFFSRKKNASRPETDGKGPTSTPDNANEASAEDAAKKEEAPTSFGQYLERARKAYAEAIGKASDVSQVAPVITQSSTNDMPVLTLPRGTAVIIQEEKSDTNGATDLFEGCIENLGQQADLVEALAPPWLAEVLLKNRVPPQPHDYNKVKFTLEPLDNLLPWICKPDRSEHLNANRMLRARKIAVYIADKLEPADPNVDPEPDALRPEAYIDLYCNNQLLTPKTTLAWMKAHIWRGGAPEMVINYKANGRKRIVPTGPDLVYVAQPAQTSKTPA